MGIEDRTFNKILGLLMKLRINFFFQEVPVPCSSSLDFGLLFIPIDMSEASFYYAFSR